MGTETSSKVELTAAGHNLSASKKALLEKRLRRSVQGLSKRASISPRAETGPAPPSFPQQQLWFIDQLEPGMCAYNMPAALRLQGRLEVAALERSLSDIVARHEILRTTFPVADGSPVQKVSPPQPLALPVVDLQSYAPEQRGAQAERMAKEEAKRPFHLAEGPLVRFTLLRLSEEEHLLVVVMHHIVSDGWSTAIVFRELELLYRATITGAPATLPPLPVQYADFASWQQQYLQGEVLEKELKYWRQQLAGAPATVALPADRTAPPKPRFQGGQVSITLSKDFYDRLLNFCHENHSTPFMALLTSLYIVLHHWTRQADLVVGSVFAGRNRRETENLVGCFMNFLPLRARLNPEQSGLELLNQVKSTFWEASSHQDCPYEKIVEVINPARKLNQNPLYNVAFLMQNWPRGQWQESALRATEMPIETDSALLDLRWLAEEAGGGLILVCEYDVDLFEPGTAQLLVESFQNTLEKLVTAPQTELAGFPIAAGLRSQVQRVKHQEPAETLAIAATFTAEPLEESLRYWIQELQLPLRLEFAPYNQVFQQLLDPSSLMSTNARGLNVVLLRVEDWARSSSPETLAGPGPEDGHAHEFLRALKTAVTRTSTPFLICLCPDSQFGAEATQHRPVNELEQRLVQELKQVRGVHVLTPEELFALYPVTNYLDPQTDKLGHVPYTPVFFTALGTSLIRRFHALKRPPRKVIAVDCDQTLWSGVCGEDGPAGIGLEAPRLALQQFLVEQFQRGMLLCLCSKNNEEDVWAVFDQHPEMPLRREHLAAWRINWHAKSENLRSLAAELRVGLDSFIFLDDNPIECAEIDSVCSDVLALQIPEQLEQLPSFLQHTWIFDQAQLTAEDRNRNLLYQQNRAREQFQAQALNFADFLAGLELKVRIEEAQPEQLPRMAQLTQRTNQFNCTTRRYSETEVEKFRQSGSMQMLAVTVSDRFGDYGLVGVLFYKPTAEALEVDTFLLSCRVLGKGVEHQMLAQLGQRAQAAGKARVDVHFIPSAKNRPALKFLESVGAAFRHSRESGSVFHFPADYAARGTFNPQQNEPPPAPVSETPPQPTAASSGFTLPAQFPRCRWIALHGQKAEAIHAFIESRARSQVRPDSDYLAPRTNTEQQLCQIWERLLRQPRVGVQDDFFQLGGTSLLAVQLFAELQKVFGKSLPLVTLFKAPTIEQLARILEQKKTRATVTSLVAIQPKGTKPPLVMVHGAGGGLLWGYANLAMKLGTDQPVYAIEPRHAPGAASSASVEQMAAQYVQELLEFQPQAPYYLGGYCFGGYIAYEMARQLSERGQRVALLALIDAAAPNGSYERIRWWSPRFAADFTRNCYYWLANFRKWEREEQRRFLARKASVAIRKLLRKTGWRKEDTSMLEVQDFIDTSQFPEDELRLWQCHLQAGSKYVPRKFPGRITLLRTNVQPILCSFEPHYGWKELADEVQVRRISGSHENIFLEPDLACLAANLKSCLEEAQAQVPQTL